MSAPECFLGVKPDGIVNTVAVATSDNVLESFRAGEVIVPCTTEQARALWGRQVMPPLDIAAAIAKATGSAT